MQEAVSQLYDGVFIFLREAMLWYTAKRLQRLKKSFDQNFYDNFSDSLDKIKQKADQIHIRGTIGHHAKATDIIHTTRNIDEKLDRLIITQEENRRSFRQLEISQARFDTQALSSSQKTIKRCTEFTSELIRLTHLNKINSH